MALVIQHTILHTHTHARARTHIHTRTHARTHTHRNTRITNISKGDPLTGNRRDSVL